MRILVVNTSAKYFELLNKLLAEKFLECDVINCFSHISFDTVQKISPDILMLNLSQDRHISVGLLKNLGMLEKGYYVLGIIEFNSLERLNDYLPLGIDDYIAQNATDEEIVMRVKMAVRAVANRDPRYLSDHASSGGSGQSVSSQELLKTEPKQTKDNQQPGQIPFDNTDMTHEKKVASQQPNAEGIDSVDVTKEADLITKEDHEHAQALAQKKEHKPQEVDNFTSLYSREVFEQKIAELGYERQIPFSVIIAGINGINLINKIFGTDVANKVFLRAIMIFKNVCGANGTVYRYDTYKLAAVLPETSVNKAREICLNLKKAILTVDNDLPPFNFSLGAATNDNIHQDTVELLTQAEKNIFRYKYTDNEEFRSSLIIYLKSLLPNLMGTTVKQVEEVASTAVQIGRSLDMTEDELQELVLLVQMQNVGIINSDHTNPQSIPEAGHKIAGLIPELAHLDEKILAIHEWWDGTGYPLGLKEERIPLASRIVAVANNYHNIVNSYPQDEKLAAHMAREVLLQGSGKQFAPQLADIICKDDAAPAAALDTSHIDIGKKKFIRFNR